MVPNLHAFLSVIDYSSSSHNHLIRISHYNKATRPYYTGALVLLNHDCSLKNFDPTKKICIVIDYFFKK